MSIHDIIATVVRDNICKVLGRVPGLWCTLNTGALSCLWNLDMVVPACDAHSAFGLEVCAYALCSIAKEIAKPVNNSRLSAARLWDAPLNSHPALYLLQVIWEPFSKAKEEETGCANHLETPGSEKKCILILICISVFMVVDILMCFLGQNFHLDGCCSARLY